MTEEKARISNNNISVVVQGAISSYTKESLESIRKILPGATIILSTWAGSAVKGLDYDVLVENEDPGNFSYLNDEFGKANNISRQIISTYEGLRRVQTTYAVKLRTDFKLASDSFVDWIDKYDDNRGNYAITQKRLVCCDTFCRNPRLNSYDTAHIAHPSDFFFFGLTCDLLKLFTPFEISDEDKLWFSQKNRKKNVVVLNRFCPEQFLWVNFLKSSGVSEAAIPESLEDKTNAKIIANEKLFASNLVVLSKEQLGIVSAKDLFSMYEPESCFTYDDWYMLYKGYCCHQGFFIVLFRIKTKLKNLSHLLKKAIRSLGKKLLFFTEKGYLSIRDIFFAGKYKDSSPSNNAQLVKYYNRSSYLKRVFKHERGLYKTSEDTYVLDDSNLSVVIQGAISGATPKTIRSIRKVLPKAEIILSTWKNSDVEGLDYDVLALSDDPGQNGIIRRYPHIQVNNTNREIVSTLEGLQKATRAFALKIRSDMIIQSDEFIYYYNSLSKYVDGELPLSRRIMVEAMATSPNLMFSICDWWYLGLTKDIIKLFDIPLAGCEEIPYFERKDNLSKWPKGENIVCRFIPESYIIYQFLLKNYKYPFYMDNQFDTSKEINTMYHKLISGGLILIETEMSGIVLPKALNVCDTAAYNFCFSLSKWVEWALNDKMLPKSAYKAVSRSTARYFSELDEYAQNYYYYTCTQWNNVIKNYNKQWESITDASSKSCVEKNDITFVVRGILVSNGLNNTFACLSSIKRFYSESKIVLAVWNNEKQEYLDKLKEMFSDVVVVVVVRPQKGPDFFLESSGISKYNSVNDQRKMVYEALKHVETNYVFVTRTDISFINDNALFFYNKWKAIFSKYDPDRRLFSERVASYNYYMINPWFAGGAKTFYLSDIIQLGRYDDICALWDGKEVPWDEQTYLTKHPNLNNPDRFQARYTAEQYFLIDLIKKKVNDIILPDWYEDNKTNNYGFEYERILASNFIIGNGIQLGISSKFELLNDQRLLTHNRIVELYLNYVDYDNEEALDYIRNFKPKQLIM